MYLFEASYTNLETCEETIKTIEFNGDVLFNNERECFLYAVGQAYDLAGEKEMLYTLEFVSC